MNSPRIHNKGFTLIELLVVISIIALLSAIVLAALSTARNKAQLAAAETFDTYNYSALGSTALAVWNFNGSATADSSGNNNNLTLYSGGTAIPITTTGINGDTAMQFDGHNYAQTSHTITLASSWTISIWVYPTASEDPFSDSGMIPFTFSLPYIIFTNTRDFGWASKKSDCATQYNVYDPTTGRALNQWYQLTLSYDNASKITSFYVNSQLVKTDNTPMCTSLSNYVTLGAQNPDYYSFPGKIDNAEVYPQALTAVDIEQLYAESLPKHLFADADAEEK